MDEGGGVKHRAPRQSRDLFRKLYEVLDLRRGFLQLAFRLQQLRRIHLMGPRLRSLKTPMNSYFCRPLP